MSLSAKTRALFTQAENDCDQESPAADASAKAALEALDTELCSDLAQVRGGTVPPHWSLGDIQGIISTILGLLGGLKKKKDAGLAMPSFDAGKWSGILSVLFDAVLKILDGMK